MGPRKQVPRDVQMSVTNARRHGRVRVETVMSSMGPLLDVSASGCRVCCKNRPNFEIGDTVVVEIHGVDGPFQIDVRIAWIRKIGWFKHEAGLEFQNTTAAARAHLANLARTALITESLEWNADKRSA
jgi:hypothetical protein